MITIIQFATAPVKATGGLLEAITKPSFHLENYTKVSHDGSARHTTFFGEEDLEFARFTFASEARGPFPTALRVGRVVRFDFEEVRKALEEATSKNLETPSSAP